MTNKKLKYTKSKRDLKLPRMKNEDKIKLIKEFPLIIRDLPYKTNEDSATIFDYFNACKNLPRGKRQIIFHGTLLTLSHAQFFLLYTVLEYGLDEDDFNKIHFRDVGNEEKAPRALVKAVSKLKNHLKNKIFEYSKANANYFSSKTREEFDEKFKTAFEELIYLETYSHGRSVETKYTFQKISLTSK